jgi:hypothetical protein
MLVSGGLLQLAAPVLADGTAAGTSISNTATASYQDPNDPTKPLNTVSNTVDVKVSEVAGITVVENGFAIVKAVGNSAAGAEVGDTVNFEFNVTNVGNDPTQFHIPGTATTTGAISATKVQYESAPGVWTDIPAGTSFTSPSVAPGGVLKVRVVANVLSGAVAGTAATVTLGNTATPGQQNVSLVSGSGDLYTVDNANGAAGETTGTPENGVREASAVQNIVIGATPQAFATIQKTHGTATASSMSYTLGLKVADQVDVPTSSNKIAADLAAAPIKLAGGTVNKVLVADAVPANTTAQSLTAPAGWTAVYTTDATSVNANDTNWTAIGTGTVTVPAGATRVGFIADGPIAKGSTTSGFVVNVGFTTTLIANGGTVANIAQVFGSTAVNGAPDLTKPVYDESGDNRPNNYNDDGTAPTTNPITTGVADPLDPSVDGSNTNTGTGPAGEPNVFTVLPPAQLGILNGTAGKPEAVGPLGNNDDFTNKSTPVQATDWVLNPTTGQYEPAPLDPASVAFTNTLQSVSAGPVSLMPTAPTTPLPIGTKVTISSGGISKTFEYDGTKFVNDGTTTPATPLVISSVTAGANVNYSVEVDLPTGTEQLKGYSIPVTAFVDANNDGKLDANEPQNTTVDRVYTGYLKLSKQAQILDTDGVSVIEAYTATPTKKAAPGQMIQYKITYSNISEAAPANSNSIALNAQKIVVTEDGKGSATNTNSWYTANGSTTVVTDHKTGSAADSNGGSIQFENGTKTNADAAISIYTNTVVGPLLPQTNGSFTFIRIVK